MSSIQKKLNGWGVVSETTRKFQGQLRELGAGGPIKKHKESTMAIGKASQRADSGARRITPAAHYPLSVRPAAQMALGLGHQATECCIVR